MPYDTEEQKRRRTMAGASRALRMGGRELSAITGEEEPEMEPRDVLRQGFRRLAGGVQKPERRYGGEE